MEPMDTSSTGSIEPPHVGRYEIGSSVPRSEPMISGIASPFTIAAPAPQPQPQPHIIPVVQIPALGQRPSQTQADMLGDGLGGFTLSEFLMQLEDYVSSVPDSVTNHYLHSVGFSSSDPRMTRLISLSTQKFISDVINEAFTHCKLKGNAPAGKGNKKQEKKFVLTVEDLAPILSDYGITLKKPMYYS